MADEDPSDSETSSSRPPSPRGQWWPERAPAQLSPASIDHLAQAESWQTNAAARVAAAHTNRRRGAGPTVYLNVYDLTNVGGTDLTGTLASLNRTLMRSWDVGLFHAGVEVAGVEYSYGFCEEGTGVYSCTPKDSPGYHFRTTVEMGNCVLTRTQINQVLSKMVKEYTGPSYSTLSRNCCTFTNELCVGLRVGEIPPWINNLASTFAPSSSSPAVRAH